MPDRPPAVVSRADLIPRLKRRIQHDKEADDRIGYIRARQAMNKAYEYRLQLADRLATTPALCMAGTVAKLSAFIDMNTPLPSWSEEENPAMPMAQEPSWPQLRSILDDLIRQGGLGNA